MERWLLSPPIAFPIVLAGVLVFSFLLSRLGSRQRTGPRGLEPYACGEDIPTHPIQPDYGQFLPFAFFFTILHVVAMMATTAPVVTGATLAIVCVYVVGAVAGLTVLYRR